MKRLLLALVPCFAIIVSVGCGGTSTETSVVETTVSEADQQLAEQTQEQYNSADYAASMSTDPNAKKKKK